MLRRSVFVPLMLVAVLTVTPFLSTSAAIQKPNAATEVIAPLAEAMPDDTLLYVVTAFDPTSEQYLGLTRNTTELLLPRVGSTVAPFVELLARFLGSVPSDLRTVLEGEIGVGVGAFGELDLTALMSPDDTASSGLLGGLLPPAVIVIHPERAAAARPVVTEWFEDQVEQTGGTVSTTEEAGRRWLETTAAVSGTDVAVVASVGDYIVLGSGREVIEPYLSTIEGGRPAVAGNDGFSDLVAQVPRTALLFGYAQVPEIVASIAGIFDASPALAAIEPPVGDTAFTVGADAVGLRFESASIRTAAADPSVVDSQAVPSFAESVPASTLALVAGRDLGQSWAIDQLQTVLLSALAGSLLGTDFDLSDIDPETQFGVISMLTGIDFRTDVFQQLTGDWGLALLAIDLQNPLQSSAVISSQLADPDRVSVAVTTLGPLIQSSGSGTASVTTASIDGQTVTNVTLQSPIEATLQYGVVDDQLMIGLGSGIEAIATSPQDRLAKDSAYSSAMSLLPSAYSGQIYIDVGAIVRQLGPTVLEALAASSDNQVIDCLAAAQSGTELADGSTTRVPTWCAIARALLGGQDGLQRLVFERIPGPIAAVGYDTPGYARVSGVLPFGTID